MNKFRENILYTGVQILFPSKNIYGCVFLIFAKIYARKWLCQAVCGHNIFFAKICWYGRQDLNLHALALEPKSNVSASFTTPAYSYTNQFYHIYVFLSTTQKGSAVFSGTVLIVLSDRVLLNILFEDFSCVLNHFCTWAAFVVLFGTLGRDKALVLGNFSENITAHD